MFVEPLKDTPFIVLAVVSIGAELTVRTGVVVGFETLNAEFADDTFVTVPPPAPEISNCNCLTLLRNVCMCSSIEVSTTFPTKIVAKGQGGFARADIEFWANGAGSTATVSDLATRINSDGTQFAKPVNTALHSMITSTANNSGDAALTFNHASTVLPTSTWGRTGIVARATGAFSQANLYFFGGTTSPSTANLVTDTRLFLNTSTSAVSLTLGNNATPIATLGAVQPALSGAALLPALRINAGAHTAGNTGEKIDWYLNGNRTVQLNTGSYSTQRFGYVSGPTLSFVGASTVTDVYSWYIDPVTAGTNATFTRNWGLGVGGNLQVTGNTYIGASGVAPTARLHLAAGTATAGKAAGHDHRASKDDVHRCQCCFESVGVREH